MKPVRQGLVFTNLICLLVCFLCDSTASFNVTTELGHWDHLSLLGLNYLFSNVIENSAEYLLIIHSYESYSEIEFPLEFKNTLLVPRIITDADYDFNTSAMEYCKYRFHMPFNTLLGPWTNDSVQNAQDEFCDASLSPTNLLTFSDINGLYDVTLNNDISHGTPLAAANILFHLHLGNFTTTVAREGYNNGVEANLGLLKRPIDFHKSVFRNGGGRTVIALVHIQSSITFMTMKERGTCPEMIRTRALNINLCSTDMLTVTYLGHTHNMTVKLLTVGEHDELFAAVSIKNQYIERRSADDKYAMANSRRFVQYILTLPIYCKPDELVDSEDLLQITLYGNCWVSASIFSVQALGLILGSNIIILFIISKVSGDTQVDVHTCALVAITFGQSPEYKTATRFQFIFLCVYLLSIFVGNLYGNSITSTVSTYIPPKVFKTINELVDNGYRFLFEQQDGENEGIKIFNSAFELRHLLSRYDEIVKLIPKAASESNESFRFAHFIQKYAFDEEAHRAKLVRLTTERAIKEDFNLSFACHEVSDNLESTPDFWEIGTVNRFWSMESMSRIDQSGIKDQLERTKDWAQRLDYGLPLFDPSNKPALQNDQITFNKLFPVLMFSALAQLIAITYFALQFKQQIIEYVARVWHLYKWRCKHCCHRVVWESCSWFA